jgi:hypothetical protein
MLVLVNDHQHWKDRAAEMRALADWMTASETQAIILRLASDYELLAVHAAGRSEKTTIPQSRGLTRAG